MTLFSKDQIPDDCQHVEQLLVWCFQILQHRYPDVTFTPTLDENGEPLKIRNIEADDYYYTVPTPATHAYAARALILLSKESQLDGRLYRYAQSFGDAEIPSQLRRVA